jgi:hypothetical protein
MKLYALLLVSVTLIFVSAYGMYTQRRVTCPCAAPEAVEQMPHTVISAHMIPEVATNPVPGGCSVRASFTVVSGNDER